jgi:hypothetical protein
VSASPSSIALGCAGLLAVLIAGACRASVNADAKVNGDGASAESSFATGEPASDVWGSAAPSPDASSAALVETSFIGVTHALTLSAAAAKTPACACVSAHVGAPSDAAFVWRGTPPKVGRDATVLALTSQGVPCDRGAGAAGSDDSVVTRGASIRSVERYGNDILVTLEEAGAGRPLAEGAVIPRPGDGGDVILRPARRGLPYARQAADGTSCRLPVQLQLVDIAPFFGGEAFLALHIRSCMYV